MDDIPLSHAREAKEQLLLAGQVSITVFFNQLISLISITVVGRLGPAELAAASLAGSIANAVGNTLILGLASTLYTVCGQAYGAQNYAAVGIWAQRGFLICLLSCFPIAALWLCAEPILLWVGQPPLVCHMTAVYIRLLLPGLFVSSAQICLSFCLQSQGIVRPGAYATIAVAVIHPPLIYCLVHLLGWGFVGGGIAVSISNTLQFLGQLSIVLCWRLHVKTWPGWSWECLRQWGAFLKLAIPGVVLVSEWWTGEIVLISAGLLPHAQRQLSAMAVYMNTGGFAYTFVFGLSVACSTRVANELGAGHPKTAQAAAAMSVLLTLIISAVLAAVILALRHPWGRLFTAEEAVLQLVQQLLIFLAGYMVIDAMQSTLQGIIRGCGKQPLAAWMVLPSYWVVGLPLALFLGFRTSLGVKGFCLGMMAGTTTYASAFAGVWLLTDWDKEAERASIRAGLCKQLLAPPEEEDAESGVDPEPESQHT